MVYSTAGTPNCSDWNSCGSGNYSWTQWTGAGLDVHSTVANPTFTNTSKTWTGRTPAYLPVGDYTPTNTTAMNAIKFQTFPMDSFGVMGTTPGPNTSVLQNPFIEKNNGISNNGFTVNYGKGLLFISNNGEYQVTITNALGRTLMTLKGKGDSEFSLNARTFRTGVYFAAVRARNGMATRRFIVD
jgi:hypothetical protein